MQDEFYQMIDVELKIPEVLSSGKLNRILKEHGAKLSYDVYSFDRNEEGFDWQSESYLHCRLYMDEREVDAQESVNKLVLSYPLATIGSEYISLFAKKIEALSNEFGATVYLDSRAVSTSDLISYCEDCVTSLMENFGEEPGSKTLAILIESNY